MDAYDQRVSRLLPLTIMNENIENNIGFEALYISALRCKKNVLWKGSVSAYILNIVERTLRLEEELKNGKYKASKPKRFTITYPKEREILSITFRDRVYQRSLNDNSIYPQMVTSFIYDNFACQKGKGTDLARERLKYYLRKTYIREHKDIYILKCDIKGYYENLPHEKVANMFRTKLDDFTATRGIKVLSDQYNGEKGYNPGSQMVQIVGISYLDGLDHYIKERLHCKAYLRYMDDFILISTDKNYLKDCILKINKYLDGIGLWLHPTKTKITNAKDGVTFLGFTFRMTNTGKVLMQLNPKNVKHERKKLFRLVQLAKKGKLTRKKVDECYASWRNHASKGNSYKLLQRMDYFYEELWR